MGCIQINCKMVKLIFWERKATGMLHSFDVCPYELRLFETILAVKMFASHIHRNTLWKLILFSEWLCYFVNCIQSSISWKLFNGTTNFLCFNLIKNERKKMNYFQTKTFIYHIVLFTNFSTICWFSFIIAVSNIFKNIR